MSLVINTDIDKAVSARGKEKLEVVHTIHGFEPDFEMKNDILTELCVHFKHHYPKRLFKTYPAFSLNSSLIS